MSDEVEYRSFEIRATDLEARTIEGLAVPYGETVEIGGSYKERFERGAFAEQGEAHLYFNHDYRDNHSAAPIGKVFEAQESDKGLYVRARISTTPKGEEVYTLLREGVLDKFSIGFTPVSSHRDDDGVVVRTKARLNEVSVVPTPAYQSAAVARVRSADNKEEKEMAAENELAELRDAVDGLEREVRSLAVRDSAPAQEQFRSGGEWLKALASNDENARTLVRAYTGATTADDGATRPGWVTQTLRLVKENRPVINLFNKAPLSAEGMTIEYPFVSATSGTVGEQANEGDDLPYMEIALDTGSAPVKTYGGYSSLSRQVIERAGLPFLETTLRYQALQYAKATEAAVRSAFVGATGVQTATLAGDEGGDWIDLVIDSLGLVDDNAKGATAEFMLVSRDVFKRIAGIKDTTGRPMFVINGDGVNSLGNVNVRGERANIAGLPVLVGKNLAANSVFVASREAVTTFENAGAPVRLQDENIINLTKDFSLYGYLAVAVTNPLAIVKVDADLV